jgi:hypothetical protein
VLVLRLQERERELLEVKKRQEEEVAKNQRVLAEQQAKCMREMAEADRQRQRRATELRETFERQAEAANKFVIQRQKEQVAHEQMMLQRRAEKLGELKERNTKLRIEAEERYEEGQRRVAEMTEQRRTVMEDKEIGARARYENLVRNRDAIAAKAKGRSQSQIDRHHQAKEELERGKEERIRGIVFKDSKDEERRREIMREKEMKMKQEREALIQKQEFIERQKEERRVAAARDAEEYGEKQKEDSKRVEEVQKKREEGRIQKVAIQKLKDQIQTENAERKQRQREYWIKEKRDLTEAREARALQYVSTRQEIVHKKQDAAAEREQKKGVVITEFRQLMKRGGDLDIEQLAKKFDIDLEVLRERVADANRRRDAGESDE